MRGSAVLLRHLRISVRTTLRIEAPHQGIPPAHLARLLSPNKEEDLDHRNYSQPLPLTLGKGHAVQAEALARTILVLHEAGMDGS